MPLKASTLEAIFFLLHRSFYAMVSHQVPLTQKEHLSEVSKSGFIGLQNNTERFWAKQTETKLSSILKSSKKHFCRFQENFELLNLR